MSVFTTIHDLFLETFKSFTSPNINQVHPALFEESSDEDSIVDGPIVHRKPKEEVIEDALDFRNRFVAAEEPWEHVYEKHVDLCKKLMKQHQEEENEAWHHPKGAILITHAYLDFLDACAEVECIISGMMGKNIRNVT